jgi:LPS-assembly protein
LSRIYENPGGGISRFRHLLVPELNYNVTGKRDLHDLPFFDYDDRPLGGQLLTFSLSNLLTGREDKGEKPLYRDLLRFNLRQGYQLSGERRDLLVLVDYGRPFTDTAVTAELMPLADWRFYSDTRVSPYTGEVTNAQLGGEAGNPAGTRVSLDYHYAREKLDYIEGMATYADFKPYLFSARARYSFDRPGFLETLYSLEYKHQCWSLFLAYRDRIDTQEFTVTFSLSGLGTLKLL